jgi:hypothetical protein
LALAAAWPVLLDPLRYSDLAEIAVLLAGGD